MAWYQGSHLGVSGPAAGLTVIVLSAISTLGSYENFLLAVVIGGIIQIILSFLKAGIIGYYFPSSVIKGMLSAIGIIIFLKQIKLALGYTGSFSLSQLFNPSEWSNLSTSLANFSNEISYGAFTIVTISLAILILWEQKFIKKIKLFGIIQAPLLVVSLGIILGNFFDGNLSLSTKQFVNIPVPSNFNEFLGNFTFPNFSAISNSEIWIIGLTIAVVASLETLLCVEATDKLDPYKRVTPTNRELLAQGAGNIVSGMIGGLPVTQVIVRSSANIQSGGRTKKSAIFHGILLLVSAMAIPDLLNQIPLASLAAILLMVGYKLAKPSVIKEMYGLGPQQFIPFAVTILGIVFTDLLIGILIGLGLSMFVILYYNFKTPYHIQKIEDNDFKIVLSEDVSFLNKASLLKTLHEIPENSRVIIDANKSVNVDYDVMEIIRDFHEKAKHSNIELIINETNWDHIKTFHSLKKFIDSNKVA